MESCWKVLIYCALVMQIFHEVHADTKIIDINSRSSIPYNYMPPSTTNNNKTNNFFQHTNSYTARTPPTPDNFNARPELNMYNNLKTHINTPLFNSYAPPPSGQVSYKNLQLPLEQSDKLPLLLPKSATSSDYNKHPGFSFEPASRAEQEFKNSQSATAVSQLQFHKTIEAANVLTSNILGESSEVIAKSLSGEATTKNQDNSTDNLLLKTLEHSIVLPKQLSQEVTKSTLEEQSHALGGHSLEGFNINQFIFVIKPDKISFFNKLV